MEHKYCEKCERKLAIMPDIKLSNDKVVSLCLECYQKLNKEGLAPSIKDLGTEYVSEIIVKNSSKKESSVKINKKDISKTKFESLEDLFILKFGKDLTYLAYHEKLDPVIGREKEVERAILVLSRRNKNNPVLLGEPGVGKTAIAEGLAQKIVKGEVPEGLKNKRIISLNVSSIVAGTKYRGEFEERMKKILDEVIEYKDMILLVDEFHTLIGAGSAEGAVDASNIMKPMLARGELQLIGATTRDEYRKYVEKDAALERRFQPIQVEEPNEEDAMKILFGIREKYEEFHGVKITDEAIEAAVQLSNKYISDRFLPDKAIDLMDEASAMKKLMVNAVPNEILELRNKLELIRKNKDRSIENINFEESKKALKQEERISDKLEYVQNKFEKNKTNAKVDIPEINIILENWTGIPVAQLNKKEKEQLKELENNLKKYVKGQDEAVEMISKSIRRNKMGLKDPKRPVGVFLLVGPTGVGKTELAKSVAKLVYGKEENMIRFDMSEFMEKHTVSKLIGAPPGYVGYEDEGKLTKLLRQKPYSLVLLDEIEKAHPSVMNILLQIYEDGRITDSKGRVINAKNAIFLMTSNAGSEVYSNKNNTLGFSSNEEIENKNLKGRVHESLKKIFKPEFLNRLDGILTFNKLSKENMKEIAEKMLNEIKENVANQGVKIEFTKPFISHMAEIGFDPEFGARTLRRELDKIKDLLSDKMIEEDKDEYNYTVDYKRKKIIIN